ncbi:50S ribosomal protein L11 methyltransferase [Stakelama tenebrarum]|uniref:Ribosomal protein L11 methyltransferase n=1 Tax=Stakelama tenebrarum TaxID=2711215 RepID=A0A6G6Y9L4_9SPHN|nr:50S ribosomal protein L11 methyltransferase [Sphingosinithalassobacter tenebrarum]QIG81497.1 50S ribosomal protein L11 methyltransferase [Sphingosinithalassobacter tenebrarum]
MSWKVTLPCTRAEAEALQVEDIALADLDPLPVLMTSERVPDDAEQWQLDAYFEEAPGAATIDALKSLVPSSTDAQPVIEEIVEEDWVTISQEGLEPVHAGRFYVHTESNKGDVPEGAHPIRIEASRAFGTGTHETTSGCLIALDALKRRGARFDNLLDLGTGTGLLAFAALHLWPRAHATASDIDPASIEVTRENAGINGVAIGGGAGELALAVASGMQHPLLTQSAPYDLIIANILAGPLVELAPSVADALAEGGTLLVAGLLDRHVDMVARAYRAQGLRLAQRIPRGDWPTLRFVKRTRYGPARTRRLSRGSGEAPGFGSW